MEVILIPEDTFTMRKYSNHPSLSIASMGIVDVNEVIQKGFSSCYWLWKIWTSFLHFKIGSWIEKYSVRFENSILRSDDHKLLCLGKWTSWSKYEFLGSWLLEDCKEKIRLFGTTNRELCQHNLYWHWYYMAEGPKTFPWWKLWLLGSLRWCFTWYSFNWVSLQWIIQSSHLQRGSGDSREPLIPKFLRGNSCGCGTSGSRGSLVPGNHWFHNFQLI